MDVNVIVGTLMLLIYAKEQITPPLMTNINVAKREKIFVDVHVVIMEHFALKHQNQMPLMVLWKMVVALMTHVNVGKIMDYRGN